MTITALQTIQQRYPTSRPRVAVVLGSGWGGLTEHIRDAVRIPYADLEGFPAATVAGHSGELWLGHIGKQSVAVMSGRKHAYETGAVDGMKLPLQVLKSLGCDVLVQTNAAGSLNVSMAPGSLMMLSDHINFSQRSPLMGAGGSARFVNMVDAYDPRLRAHAKRIGERHDLSLHEGVYVWFLGPQFETPAEIRMFAAMGADAVGMSTVPETILARHSGMRVLAVSLLTNMAAGLSGEQLSHDHTLTQAKAAGAKASGFLADVIGSLDPLA